MSKHTKVWLRRSQLKNEMLNEGRCDVSGTELNGLAGLPENKTMPRRLFGL